MQNYKAAAAAVPPEEEHNSSGVNPRKFGPTTWAFYFGIARLVDEFAAGADVNAADAYRIRRMGRQQIRLGCDMLPCLHCRVSSTNLIDNEEPAWWWGGRSPPLLGEYVFWFRLAVNRKLLHQELDAAAASSPLIGASERRAAVYRKWRDYAPKHICGRRGGAAEEDAESTLLDITSPKGMCTLLTMVWWSFHSNVTRGERVSTFLKHLEELLRATDHREVARAIQLLRNDLDDLSRRPLSSQQPPLSSSMLEKLSRVLKNTCSEWNKPSAS